MSEPVAIEPETKDWTFVIESGCSQCGYTPHDVAYTGERLRAVIPVWQDVLTRPRATERPAPKVWSPVEYACHVRDVCRIFRGRLELMLAEDDPTFANWDQDAAAVESDYFHQHPATVAAEFDIEATATAAAFDAVTADEWARRGLRSDGSEFTVETFARYFLHDVEHHAADVRDS